MIEKRLKILDENLKKVGFTDKQAKLIRYREQSLKERLEQELKERDELISNLREFLKENETIN